MKIKYMYMLTLFESHCRVCSAMFPSVNLKENKRNLETNVHIANETVGLSSCQTSDRILVKDNSPLATQKTVSLDFDEEQAREVRQGNFKNLTNYHRLLIVPAAIWLKYCRYIVKPYTINQSFESVWKDLTLLKKQEEYS